MLEDLAQLNETARSWKSRRGVDWAWVTIELVDVPAGLERFSGVVLIDGRQMGYLVGNHPREFRLAPGEHSIAVHLGRIARVAACPGRGIVKAQVELKPGERVELACGIDPGVVKAWKQFGRRCGRLTLFGASLFLITPALVWLLFPILQPSAAEVVRILRMWDLVALSQKDPKGFRMVLSFYSLVAPFLLFSLPLGIWATRASRRLLAKVGTPYRIGRRMGERVEP